MSIFPPVYPSEDLEKLDEEGRNELRMAIIRQLQSDNDVRELLRKKTRPAYEQLIAKKRKPKG